MSWTIGHWGTLGGVAGKAVLMYASAVVGLRVGERRTLAQWTIIDFVTAIAIGAIVGRTVTAGTSSWVIGTVALWTLIVVHRLASLLRFHGPAGKLFEHRIRVLVVDGEVNRRELRRCGLTDNDLFAHLRERDVFDLARCRYVLYEAKGNLSIVTADAATPGTPPLVEVALRDAVTPAS